MNNYKRLNVIVGWFAFAISAIVYLMTMEPTVSFWDCGEFITTAFKLEVGHPPGAPFFMLLGRLFTVWGGPSTASLMMNIWSALASGFTIMFLFWTITHLTKRLIVKEGEPSLAQIIAILGSGLVGGLAYTFSDTFWFSAVEAEVYATSSLFTAIVFWAILKWENEADQPHANRWIILIAYLAGLSIGVHLLNLLAIPAIAFIYYYKNYKVTPRGIFFALAISGVILGAILIGIIPGVVKVASWFELLFVNAIGLPLNSGVFIFFVLLIALIVYGIYYTHKKQKVLLNTIIMGITVILIGYSTYAIIPIRSAAKLPMDQNSPDDVFSMLGYLNRTQYGDTPLFYGQYYNTPLDSKEPYIDDAPQYIEENGKYRVSQIKKVPNYVDQFSTYFPRMWSRNDSKHISAYKQWGKIEGHRMKYDGETIVKPTMGENMRFFFRYQVNFMYWRYFMWNFVGRQNDIQGHGEALNGNWISGIKFIDQARLGNQDDMPDKFVNNPGRNVYFFLPLLLGLLGIVFQYESGKQGKRDLWVVFLLFFSTGLAIVLYLNQYPYQPRERDYAYAGSFYAFTIWIGLGVAGLYHWLKKFGPKTVIASSVTVVSLVAVPTLMATQNWDDHNRAGRYSARDFGQNYLNSIQENGVIFTNGDNDTYPLWYNQEVEGVGTSKRVCNLSYFQTDWYVSQMQRKAYESDPLPISFEYSQYVMGNRDIVYIIEDPRLKGKSIELGKAIDFIKSDDPKTKFTRADNAAYLPVRNLYMKVDKQAVIANKVVAPELYDQIVDTMFISISGSYITKDQLMLLDMLYNNNWKRPLYYAISVTSEKHLGLDKYFSLEGLAYKIVPIRTDNGNDINKGYVNTDVMYDNLMNKFKFGNLKGPRVYVDENNRRMCTNLRSNYHRLASELLKEGKKDSCVAVLDRCMEELPAAKIPYDYFTVEILKDYFGAGAKEKAVTMANAMVVDLEQELNYYFGFEGKDFSMVENEIRTPLYFLNEIAVTAQKEGENELSDYIHGIFDSYYSKLRN